MMTDIRSHEPVLLEECINALRIQAGGKYVDCTVGGGGHAESILRSSSPGGQLIGIDADRDALRVAEQKLKSFGSSVTLVNENFRHLKDICNKHGFKPVDGILFDLGVSSLQLSDASRGFSFLLDSPLDMRFSASQAVTAADIVNTYSEGEIAQLLYKYGEESRSRQIARLIIQQRPLKTTLELARLVEKAVTRKYSRIHPATKTFQALRIAINEELENLEIALEQVPDILASGGRIVIISFHSLEDRLVKTFLQREARGCICAPGMPVCICGHTPRLRIITKKVVIPSAIELQHNPRSRSARMRAGERI